MALGMVQKRFYGLMRDDVMDEENEIVTEALRRLPTHLVDERNYRIIRAAQLSLQHIYLPKEQWMTLDKDVLYLSPYVDQVIAEQKERDEWNKNH
ncbi:hypothetical protein FQA39_LY07295 [Lamprigera yunnana]|nr:hypothetical protein FQA39_LY07295 [Lamprigera yunnana]